MTDSANKPPGTPGKPPRRIRYKGTHPRRFEEKYKELNPERYAEDIAKIQSRGMTAAGTHRPIAVSEVIAALKPEAGQTALDATLGYGGHSTKLLEILGESGKLFAMDQDPIERPKTESRLRARGFGSEQLVIGASNFSQAKSFLHSHGQMAVDMVLADLGLSSMQIDDPARGFSFKVDAPLDLRMNPQTGEPASRFLESCNEAQLEKILIENSDELYARQISKSVCQHRPQTTTQLADAVREVLKGLSPKRQKEQGDSPIRRTFQAIRIAVNSEFATLEKFLNDIPDILKPGGRVAILTFHSGEDRRVKKSFQNFQRTGIYKDVVPDPIRPSLNEQRDNPRSKSAKLRWAVRA